HSQLARLDQCAHIRIGLEACCNLHSVKCSIHSILPDLAEPIHDSQVLDRLNVGVYSFTKLPNTGSRIHIMRRQEPHRWPGFWCHNCDAHSTAQSSYLPSTP